MVGYCCRTRLFIAAGATTRFPDVTMPEDALSLAVIVYVPVVLIVRSLNVATPLLTVAETVDDPVLNVPLLSVKVTVELSDGSDA